MSPPTLWQLCEAKGVVTRPPGQASVSPCACVRVCACASMCVRVCVCQSVCACVCVQASQHPIVRLQLAQCYRSVLSQRCPMKLHLALWASGRGLHPRQLLDLALWSCGGQALGCSRNRRFWGRALGCSWNWRFRGLELRQGSACIRETGPSCIRSRLSHSASEASFPDVSCEAQRFVMYPPLACQAFHRCQRRMAKGRAAAAKSSSLYQTHDPQMPRAHETAAPWVPEVPGRPAQGRRL